MGEDKEETKKNIYCSGDVVNFLSTIQFTINRMSGNSIIFKTLFSSIVAVSITVYFAGFGFSSDSVAGKSPSFPLALMLGSCFFIAVCGTLCWIFDAYYLSLERGYVNLYNSVANTKDCHDCNFAPITAQIAHSRGSEERKLYVLWTENYHLDATSISRTKMRCCLFSRSVFWFYAVLLSASLGIVLMVFFWR